MPPELNEVTRPLAMPSPQSCGGTISAGLPTPRPTDVGGEVRQTSCPSLTGPEENGTAVAKAPIRASSLSVVKFLIAPDLRAVFAEVGATDKAYTFKEILGFLKAYLYSKRDLFDKSDILYVNCKDDQLGNALQVDRFHYNEVRQLIARHVIPVGVVKLEQGAENSALHQDLRRVNTYPHSPVAGSSRQFTQNISQRKSKLPTETIKFSFPETPESNSDSESIYSCQGYETEYCRNTEFEDSDVTEEEIEFEEYELASDENDGQDNEQSDDSDSMIEDVKVAPVAVYEDEIEEEFWADDSDTDEQSSTDDDPELTQEKWDCLTCGIKNKPFVRYCGKCWQLRKNWLPERPKKKKRKPRQKKKLRKRSDSLVSEPSVADYKGSEKSGEESLARELSTDSGLENNNLNLTSSFATAVSIESTHSTLFRSYSLDSGICLSQDRFTESSQSSQDIVMEDIKEEASSTRHPEDEPSCSTKSDAPRSSTCTLSSSVEKQDRKEVKSDKSRVIVQSSERKRKSSSVEDDIKFKKSKISYSSDSEDESPEIIVKSKRQDLSSRSTRSEIERDIKKCIDIGSLCEPISEEAHMCMICCIRPKNAVMVHGRLSHQATCYSCARRLINSGARCPVCRRKIHMVCKNIVV